MNYSSDQSLYDHCLYPSRWPFLVMGVLGLIAGLVLCVLAWYRTVDASELWWIATIIGLGVFSLGMFVCSIFVPRMLMVGIRSDGVFIRRYGMVLWDDIKQFDIVTATINGSTEKNIYITLHNPDDFFARLPSWHQRLGKYATQSRVVIQGSFVSMKIEKLRDLLQESHYMYTQKL